MASDVGSVLRRFLVSESPNWVSSPPSLFFQSIAGDVGMNGAITSLALAPIRRAQDSFAFLSFALRILKIVFTR